MRSKQCDSFKVYDEHRLKTKEYEAVTLVDKGTWLSWGSQIKIKVRVVVKVMLMVFEQTTIMLMVFEQVTMSLWTNLDYSVGSGRLPPRELWMSFSTYSNNLKTCDKFILPCNMHACNILSSPQFCIMSNSCCFNHLYTCVCHWEHFGVPWRRRRWKISSLTLANNDFWWSTLSMMMNNFHDGAYNFNDWRLILNNAL